MAIALVATDEHGPDFFSGSGEIITLSNISITANNVLLVGITSGTDPDYVTALNGNTTASPSTYDQPFTKVVEWQGTDCSTSIWRRVLSGSEGTSLKTTQNSGISTGAAIIRDFSGVDTTTPVSASASDTTNVATDTTTQDTGTVSSANTGMATVWVGGEDGRNWAAADTSWGTAVDLYEVGEDEIGGVLYTGNIAYTGGSGNVSDTLTTTDTGDQAVGLIVLLKEAAAGGPDYSETLSSSVTSSANLVETYQAPAYSEVLASSVTSSATFAETYGAPAYSEVLASSVSSSANLVETYGAPNYSEVLASAVTSSASLVEAYEFGQAYSETITASVTSSATFAEAYQAPAYNETIAVSVTSSANLVETWEVAYTEVIASAVTSSATLAEIYESGLNFAETISASVTSSANLVETYGAPSYSEVLASAVTPSATFTETFTTPQALPTIVELSAITLPGYSAKSLRID